MTNGVRESAHRTVCTHNAQTNQDKMDTVRHAQKKQTNQRLKIEMNGCQPMEKKQKDLDGTWKQMV